MAKLFVHWCESCGTSYHSPLATASKCDSCIAGIPVLDESPLTLEKKHGEWTQKQREEIQSFIAAHDSVTPRVEYVRLSTPSADPGETGVSFPVISGLSYKP